SLATRTACARARATHDRPDLIGNGRYALAPASRLLFGCNPNLGILKDGRERSAAAVRERICPALTIVHNESPDGHGVHRTKSPRRTLSPHHGQHGRLRN